MTKLVRPLPTEYRISSDFMKIRVSLNGNIPHKGVDIAASNGTNIRASGSGIVIWEGFNGRNKYIDEKEKQQPGKGFGNTVIVEHPDGKISLYAHMQKTNVKSGDVVKTGDSIGKVGDTGHSTGNHLHYEVVDGNQKVAKTTLIKNIIDHNSDKPDKFGAKITGIPATILREDPKKHFNKRYYVWHTAGDDKVRESHAKLDGQIFSYDDKLFPGEEHNCRCWAEELPEKCNDFIEKVLKTSPNCPSLNQCDIIKNITTVCDK